MKNGFNINALTSQEEADMGRGPVYYSTLADIEIVDTRLDDWGFKVLVVDASSYDDLVG